MMDAAVAILLILLSWGFFVLEPIIPSFGVLSVTGLLLGGAGLYSAFGTGSAFGWTMLAVWGGGIPAAYLVGLKLLPYSPIVLRGEQPPLKPAADAEEGEAPDRKRTNLAPGARGRTVTALRPMGAVRFDDGRREARSDAGVVPANAEVEVVRLEGGVPVVAPVEAAPGES